MGERSRDPSPRFARLGLVVCNAFYVKNPPWLRSQSQWTPLRWGWTVQGGGLVAARGSEAAERGGRRHVAAQQARHICRRSLVRRSDACKSSPLPLRGNSKHMHAISSLTHSLALAKEPCQMRSSQPPLFPRSAATLLGAATSP